MIAPDVRQQYQTTDPLRTRIETHRRYSERAIDLDAACRAALGLTGTESLLDIGCGPGDWPRWLRRHGHAGRLAGLDQSRGMIAAARAAGEMNIAWCTGTAVALPFPDDSFDIVTARHMLYHVPAIPTALHEFARVAGRGGTVFATTNSRHGMPRMMALKDEMLDHFGLPVQPPPSLAFGIENARDILDAIFPRVEETILTNALVFTTPEPVVAYLMTTMAMQQTAHEPPLFDAIRDWLHREAARRLAVMGGVWRDPKDVGLYHCRGGMR